VPIALCVHKQLLSVIVLRDSLCCSVISCCVCQHCHKALLLPVLLLLLLLLLLHIVRCRLSNSSYLLKHVPLRTWIIDQAMLITLVTLIKTSFFTNGFAIS